MKILCLLFVLHTAFAQPGFGRSYLGNSRLCHQWNCINTKIGLLDSLPPIEQFNSTLRALLPSGKWQEAVEQVVQICYNNRPRRYTNTCPGQALLQCTVDQLVNNCPEENVRKDDACAPVNSLAGLSNMFSQSRYENLERNIPFERRPKWFLRNYFDSKCCNLPQLFNSTILTECGFTTMMQYFKHDPHFETRPVLPRIQERPVFFHYTDTKAKEDVDSLRIVGLNDIKPVEKPAEPYPDPLTCCDLTGFINPGWQQRCAMQLDWSEKKRLSMLDVYNHPTTTVAPVQKVIHRDLMVVPQTCELETCVFNKLNITSSSAVDIEAYKKLLDSLTDSHPIWNKAKARVLTTCLGKPLEYVADCEINKVLACTFDVLSENCPISESSPKHDACKHSRDDIVCQISSSKSRPKNRRSVCILPQLVEQSVLSACGLDSLSRVEQVVQTMSTKPKSIFPTYKSPCVELNAPTRCILQEMGAFNKYDVVDYFKLKDKIRRFASQSEWSEFLQLYLNAYQNTPLYSEYCSSEKKLLNVIDAMLMTCPASKRKTTAQCTRLLQDIADTPVNKNVTKQYADQVFRHYHHVFYPSNSPTPPTTEIVKKPLYNFGILSSALVPKVEIIDLKPKDINKPLILLPVYMRVPNNTLAFVPRYYNGLLRRYLGSQNQISQGFASTVSYGPTCPTTNSSSSSAPVSTTPISTTISSTTPSSVSSTPISTTISSTTLSFSVTPVSTAISSTTASPSISDTSICCTPDFSTPVSATPIEPIFSIPV